MSSRSPDFRWIYANGFHMQMNENEMLIGLGVTEDISNPGGSINEQVGVALTLRGAKLLGKSICDAIANYEKAQGIEIPISPTVVAFNPVDLAKKQ